MRLKDWQSRLQDVLAAAKTRPFTWGEHDCCLFGADVVRAQTGRDPAEKWRGTYGTASEAVRLLAELGGLDALCAMAGSEADPVMAGLGDVGIAASAERECVCVHSGQCWLAVTADDGLAIVPRETVRRAWKVGA